jgi:hypothetical protein
LIKEIHECDRGLVSLDFKAGFGDCFFQILKLMNKFKDCWVGFQFPLVVEFGDGFRTPILFCFSEGEAGSYPNPRPYHEIHNRNRDNYS